MGTADFDICIIGGGIHGASIARDAAGRGLSVLLLEKDDLANHTSSASSKMLHGGLRYLEYFEFRLVKEALAEREILLDIAPHIIRPMDFYLPHANNLRPAWMVRLGLFLYDHLAGRQKLRKSAAVKMTDHASGAPLKSKFKKGFVYADGWMDDARLTVLNAMDAKNYGAVIKTRAPCTSLKADTNHWRIAYKEDGQDHTATANTIINAAGPWVKDLLDQNNLSSRKTPDVRLVKGSHIVVPRLYEGDHAYILQQPDKRVVFVWPYGPDYNYIGTTDVDFENDPDNVKMDQNEAAYLCEAINRFFEKQITPQDIAFDWSGVRTLVTDGHDNASAVSRDYELDHEEINGLDIYSVFGGKLTTSREVAEKVADKVSSQPRWTHKKPLPGGNIKDMQDFIASRVKRYAALPEALIARYANTYGTKMDDFIRPDMGEDFGSGLYQAEVDYLVHNEWARTAEDILSRRTKLVLTASPETKDKLDSYLEKIKK